MKKPKSKKKIEQVAKKEHEMEVEKPIDIVIEDAKKDVEAQIQEVESKIIDEKIVIKTISATEFAKNLQDLFEDDNKFDYALKEYLNITAYPNNPDGKLNVFKKLIHIYKNLKDEEDKQKFIEKLSEKIAESPPLVNSLMEIEFIKNKREGNFAHLSKLISKFAAKLAEIQINDLSCLSLLDSNEEVSQSYKNIRTKIEQYLVFATEIQYKLIK